MIFSYISEINYKNLSINYKKALINHKIGRRYNIMMLSDI